MNDSIGEEVFASRWVVPTEESRAELAEWGLRTTELQNEYYRKLSEAAERLHQSKLNEEYRLGR